MHQEVLVLQGLSDIVSRTQAGLHNSAVNGLRTALQAQNVSAKR